MARSQYSSSRHAGKASHAQSRGHKNGPCHQDNKPGQGEQKCTDQHPGVGCGPRWLSQACRELGVFLEHLAPDFIEQVLLSPGQRHVNLLNVGIGRMSPMVTFIVHRPLNRE